MSVWARPLRPVATWMNASWFSNCAESLAVKRASRRILIRLVEATAFADNSSTSSTSGASSPKWSFTATFDELGDLLTGTRAEHGRKQRGRTQLLDRRVDLLREFERRGRIETQRLLRHPVQLPAVRMEGRCPDRHEHERSRLDGRRLTVEPVVDHVAGAQEPSCCGDPVEHVRRVDRRVFGLGQSLRAVGEEALADLGRARRGQRARGSVSATSCRMSAASRYRSCGVVVTGKVCQAGAWPTRLDRRFARVVADRRYRQESEAR